MSPIVTSPSNLTPVQTASPAGASNTQPAAPAISSRPAPMPPATTLAHDWSNQQAWNLKGRYVYMIGIGGCGMSGLARMLRARGAIVRGSDMSQSEATDALADDGISVDFDQSRQWLPGTDSTDRCDLVVCSAAIKPDHPQLLEAVRRGIEHLTYAEALGRCMIGRTGVAIAGTHGKSTTTSMLSCILSDAGLASTAIVGATCAQLAGTKAPAPASSAHSPGFVLGQESLPVGPLSGRPGILLAEACEFNRSFHNYHPSVACITSVEADHLDIYGSLDAVVESFQHFARLVAPERDGGLLLIAHDNAHRREVTAGVAARVATIGFSPDADWSVRYDRASRTASLVSPEQKVVLEWTMLMPGEHNAMNAAFAATLALHLGAAPESISRSLSAFRGVDRRAPLLGTRPLPTGGSVRVYDDYGHHPTECDATLRAIRHFEQPQKNGGRLICIFQPHQHSRTRHLMQEFAVAFSEADVVIVPHIYFVRDSQEEKSKVTAGDLVDELRKRGVFAMHLYPFEAIVEQLEVICRPNDVVLVMGAGPVYQIGQQFLARASNA
ncbi:MAG: UDP-N-acetylmuramate--L-alanine ligase [Phycisphaerales bacterium]